MKTLVGLSVLQTIAIAALVVHALREPAHVPVNVQPATPIAASTVATAVEPQQRAVVEQQIENYRGVGAITESQMQDLQADIAQLDDAPRRQMMSKLIRALNSGDIKGRL